MIQTNQNIFKYKSHMMGTAVQMVLKTRPVCSVSCGGTLRLPGAGSTVAAQGAVQRLQPDDHEWQEDKWSAADDLWQEIWKRDSVTANGELNCSQKHWRVSPIIETDVLKKIGNLKFPLLLLNGPGKKRSSFQGTTFFFTVGKRHNRQITAIARSLFFLFEFLGSRLTRLIIF